jgi:hypothetical protein
VKTASIPSAYLLLARTREVIGRCCSSERVGERIKKVRVAGLKSAIKVNPKEFGNKLSGKKAIFFKDYWRRTVAGNTGPLRNRSGEYVDIRNGSRTTEVSSWARINLRIGSFGIRSITDRFSDFEDSSEIRFWGTIQ